MKKLVALLLALAMVLSFAACAKKEETAAEETQVEDLNETKPIIVALEAEPVALDPAKVSDSNSYKVVSEMYRRLVTWDDSGYTVKGDLAESWTISEDNLTYTFNLVQNAVFHDGSKVTADAVVFSLMRQIDENHEAYSTGPFPMAKSYLSSIESVTAVSDYVVEIKLKYVNAPFINFLAQTCASIVNPDVIKANLSDTTMVDAGCGPYKLVEWQKGVGVTLTRFDEYFGETAKVKDVYFVPVTEALTRAQMLMNGEADIIASVDPDLITTIQDAGYDVDQAAGTHVWFLVPNMSKAPFNNDKVREALQYAIDREAIVNDVLGGTGTVANQMLSPACMGRLTDLDNYEYNPEKAKQLLAEAGYPDGFEINFLLPESGSGMQSCVAMCTLIQSQLEQVGIKANMTTMEFGAYMDVIFGDSCKGDDAPYDLWAMSWTSSSGDDSSCLKQLFSVAGIPAYNSGYYTNEKVDQLISEANSTTDQTVRKAKFQEIGQMIVDDNAAVFVDYGNQIVGCNPNLNGLMLHPDQVYRLSRLSWN